jgi:amino acid adenylation domain-containing protein
MLSSVLVDLETRNHQDAGKEALTDGDKRFTFSDIYGEVQAIGSYLKNTGIAKGDRVGVLMSKTFEQPIAQLGVLAANAVLVPISDLLKPAQVNYIINDCDIRTLIVDHDKLDRLDTLRDGVSIIVSGCESHESLQTLHAARRAQSPGYKACVIGSDNAAIIYSSGSTGMPKGIVLTHRNILDGARIVSSYLGLQAEDRIAGVMSLNFDYGLNQLFCCLRTGASLHLSTFHFPKDLFNFLSSKRITTLPLMPVFLNRLFDPRFFSPEFAEAVTTLSRITTSGGRMPQPTLEAIQAAFPDTEIFLMYGLTEAFRSTYLDPAQVMLRPDSIGKAIPDVQLMVLDEGGNECAANQPGELVHRGGVIARGYWNDPDRTAERFRLHKDASGNEETVVYSGDLVRRDEEGYLYFIGRRDNMIKTSGHRVSPEEIERAAEAVEGIADAVVFSRHHDVLGEEIIMVCSHKNSSRSPDEFELKSALRKELAAYMIPRTIVFADSFGVTAGNQGKIDRETARKFAEQQLSEK